MIKSNTSVFKEREREINFFIYIFWSLLKIIFIRQINKSLSLSLSLLDLALKTQIKKRRDKLLFQVFIITNKQKLKYKKNKGQTEKKRWRTKEHV